MDVLDMKVLRTLGFIPFCAGPRDGLDALKPSTVARRLGIRLELAKDRISRLEEQGVIHGYDVTPNPLLFGLDDVTFHMQLKPAIKDRVLRDAGEVDGVIGVYDYVGPHLCVQVMFRSPSDLERKRNVLTALTGSPRPPDVYFRRSLPKPQRRLKSLEWRILRALRHQARRSPASIADDLGISARTVQRWLRRMANEGAFDAVAEVDWGRLRGIIAFELIVTISGDKSEAALAEVRKALDDHTLTAWQSPSDGATGLNMSMWATSPSEMEVLRRRAESIAGVDEATTATICSSNYSGSWLDDAIDAAIDATGERSK